MADIRAKINEYRIFFLSVPSLNKFDSKIFFMKYKLHILKQRSGTSLITLVEKRKKTGVKARRKTMKIFSKRRYTPYKAKIPQIRVVNLHNIRYTNGLLLRKAAGVKRSGYPNGYFVWGGIPWL